MSTIDIELSKSLNDIDIALDSIRKLIGKESTYSFIIPKIIDAGNDADLEKSTKELLHRFAMPTDMNGYRYLVSACMIGYKEPQTMELITKFLYPQVAKLHNSTPERVERSMRTAIEKAFDRCEVETLIDFFGYSVDEEKGRPTNREFITAVIRKLEEEILV